ncbi:P-loop containing nucleoside triphosphate hydrolase protein [Mycena metata]|uniref:DNA 3'-5' helicase n=1 Tax=Mycena metata TaxID=1033252 RepID=A0AAD7NB21_9AGAR|nr:P-loop containing nucleoside triphosphate hydrolase protein [Mycena metata]
MPAGTSRTGRNHGKTPNPTKRRTRGATKITPEQLEAIHKELELLPGLIRTHFTKWTNGAKPFQLECMGAQKLGKEVLLHAATGAGKTGIAAGPHLLPSSKGKVTLMVSPLLSLHDEQVSTFQNEFGLKATAINSANGGCTKDVIQKVVAGEWQIVMLSPEMLLSRCFVDGVLRRQEFGSRCLSVFIDEAHCVSHWGASFRKKYAALGIIRAFLPRTTSIVAVTATLTPRVHQDLITKLQFDRHSYLFCTIGNDRPNVSQVIRAMEHPANSYRDMDFVVPADNKVPADTKQAFVYTDDIKDGGKLVDHLNDRVHPDYRSWGLVRPYNAGMSREYRATVMSLFKAGIIRVLVCTDAAGMGCDIPNIELVVQWKAPQNLSAWVQRAGRAARAAGLQGIAVMLVEKSAFEVNSTGEIASTVENPTRGRGRGRGRGWGRGRGGGRGGPKQGKDYAVSHGQKRGSFRGTDDAAPVPDAASDIPDDAPGEGLYTLIQATVCRRTILGRVFQNKLPHDVPPLLCCDICNPKLFDQTRPSEPVRSVRQKGIRKGPPVASVRQALFTWRRNILKMHYPGRYFAANAILDDATCELLASVGPIDDLDMLHQLLASSWSRWDDLGDRLYAYLHGLDIPALPPPPAQKKPAAAVPQPPPNAPTPSASRPVPPPSRQQPQAPAAPKRPNLTQGTSRDEFAPPAIRARTDSPSIASGTPLPSPYRGYTSNLPYPAAPSPMSSIARPQPRPRWKNYMTPPSGSHASHASSSTQPPPSPIALPPRYVPSSMPVTPASNYVPYPYQYYNPAYSPFPQSPSPSFSSSHTIPATLRHNPYAALYSPSPLASSASTEAPAQPLPDSATPPPK